MAYNLKRGKRLLELLSETKENPKCTYVVREIAKRPGKWNRRFWLIELPGRHRSIVSKQINIR